MFTYAKWIFRIMWKYIQHQRQHFKFTLKSGTKYKKLKYSMHYLINDDWWKWIYDQTNEIYKMLNLNFISHYNNNYILKVSDPILVLLSVNITLSNENPFFTSALECAITTTILNSSCSNSMYCVLISWMFQV